MSAEERIAELKKTLEIILTAIIIRTVLRFQDYEYDMMMQELKGLKRKAPGACHAGFSDTACWWNSKKRSGCACAPQCSDVKSSGCFFQRGSI